MLRLKWHRTLRAIRKGCAKDGIAVEVIKSRGKGSHKGVVFRREGEVRGVLVVFAGGEEVSQGAQRRVLQELSRKSEKFSLAGEVLRIVERVFRNGGVE